MKKNRKTVERISARIFRHLETCEECQKRWKKMGLCSGVGKLTRDTWSGYCQHSESCESCQKDWNEICDHAFYEITSEDILPILDKMEKEEWVPYEKRQVYAALNKAPVELCLKCPYFKKFEFEGESGVNVHGQPGECCFCRWEADHYGMKGDVLCRLLF